jgi:hypothetical protein
VQKNFMIFIGATSRLKFGANGSLDFGISFGVVAVNMSRKVLHHALLGDGSCIWTLLVGVIEMDGMDAVVGAGDAQETAFSIGINLEGPHEAPGILECADQK